MDLGSPGLHRRTDAECERKTEVKDDSRFLGRSVGKMGLPSTRTGKTVC